MGITLLRHAIAVCILSVSFTGCCGASKGLRPLASVKTSEEERESFENLVRRVCTCHASLSVSLRDQYGHHVPVSAELTRVRSVIIVVDGDTVEHTIRDTANLGFLLRDC
jgi:hypothetical protein